MRLVRPLVVLALAALARPLVAQQSGAFVIRLGADTVSVERFTRSATRLEGDAVNRQPRTTLRHYVVDFAPDGRVQRAEVVLQRPGAAAGAAPIQRTVATFTGDSVVVETRRDTAVQMRRVAVGASVVPILGGASTGFVSFELLVARLRQARADSVGVRAYTIGAASGTAMAARTLGRDSVWIYDGNDVFHVRVDREGRIWGAAPLSGTQQFTVERVASADIAALATLFAARDGQGQGLGVLSPRDTVRASIGGASLWVDYSRPAKRGRAIFGGTVVPWGQVWRTGANAATQLRTDRPLEMGGVLVPAGMYTLWTIPSASGWKLLINSQTGQWGTEHDARRDLYQLDLRTATLAQPVERFTISVQSEGQGGVLRLQWDTTEASIPFTVR